MKNLKKISKEEQKQFLEVEYLLVV
ncbi:bacteriocin-like protein [Chryseobacterium aquaticum]